MLGILVLMGGVLILLVGSWNRWNDPIIDFGRELYTPWRLSLGEVLFRDVQSVYGPFSQLLNALLFKTFGPGMSVLVYANIAVLLLILSLAYLLFRRAWGRLGAWAACAVFITVFSLSRYLPVANFNYVAPYAHEVTHGMLTVLALAWAALRWVEHTSTLRSIVAGSLFGLTLVIKPEFILAGSAVGVAALVLRLGLRWGLSCVPLAWVAGAATMPTLLMLLYFWRFMPLAEAAQAATNAWWGTLTHSISGIPYQKGLLGFDQPLVNLQQHLFATLVAITVVGGVFFAMRFLARIQPRNAWWLGGLVGAPAIVLGAAQVEWIHAGRCLLGLALAYLGALVVGLVRSYQGGASSDPNAVERLLPRVLLTVLAVAMMARMVLNGRIWQFGFFQAALAAMVVAAVIITEIPILVSTERRTRRMTALILGSCLVTGMVFLTKNSWQRLAQVTHEVGSGRDRFLSFPPLLDGHGDTVRQLVGALGSYSAATPLLVLPEGLMVNYLARMRSPLPHFQYYSFTTEQGKEAVIVEQLKQNPPGLVALLSRDLTDFGIERYGQKSGAGLELLTWVQANYFVVQNIYDDPLDRDRCGAILLQYRFADPRRVLPKM